MMILNLSRYDDLNRQKIDIFLGSSVMMRRYDDYDDQTACHMMILNLSFMQ